MNYKHKKSIIFILITNICSFFYAHSENQEELKAVLITVLYNETHEQRLKEFITCFEHNKKHPAISHMHVLYDTTKDTNGPTALLDYLKKQPCTITYISGRPTFGQCFELANKTYPDTTILLSNADIYFNDTLNALNGYDVTNKFLALTRWNVLENSSLELFKQYKSDGSFDDAASFLSQDVWIFKTPIRQFANPHFRLGTWACDGYIAYQAYLSGLEVLNPCLTIQCCHLHLSQVRHWIPQSIPGAKALIVPWCRL